MNNAANNYSVEGHGRGILVKGGQERTYNRGLPYFTREQAWDYVKELKSHGDMFHTIIVRRGNEIVWEASRHTGWSGKRAA